MPVTYELQPEAGFVETLGIGEVTLEEVLAHFAALGADPSLPERLDVLLDLGGVTSIPESNQLREIARALDALRARVRWGVCAIVANRDALYGMSRMFEVFAEGLFVRTSVFRERAEAERWLAGVRSTSAGR